MTPALHGLSVGMTPFTQTGASGASEPCELMAAQAAQPALKKVDA